MDALLATILIALFALVALAAGAESRDGFEAANSSRSSGY